MFGTLAPEQVAEFMESLVDAATAREISDLLGQLDVPDPDKFGEVWGGLDMALPTDDLVAELRAILRHSFQEGEPVMELLKKIERDQASSAFAVLQARVAVDKLRDSAVKFAADLEDTLKTVNDKLRV